MAQQPPDEDTETLYDSVEPVAAPDERPYLVVFDSDTVQRAPLSDEGEVLIGRAEDAPIRVRSATVSRRHAKIVTSGGDARIVDLGSHNGVAVNGKPISGAHLLRPRDSITLGDVTLIFYAGLRAQRRRSLADLAEVRARAAALIAQKKPFGLAALALRIEASEREAVEHALPRGQALVAWSGIDQLVILLHDAGAAEVQASAAAHLEALHDLTAGKAGCATYPADGAGFDELLAHAGHAVLGAHTGEVSSQASSVIELPEATILLGDPSMIRLYQLLEKLAASELPILIGGETGTGKELAASAVHHWSARRGRPFVALNCATLPENLAESELFGYEKGAFSGAQTSKVGLLEAARGGTVFLDEIGELSLGNQAKLLRVLETRRLLRLGDVKERPIDIRVIAATNRDLEAECDAGRFRRDLFFRLSGAIFWLPPLRDRPREILTLAKRFLDAACDRMGRKRMVLATSATQVLLRYRWTGNIRELKNVMDYVAVATAGAIVGAEHLPARVAPPRETAATERDRTIDTAGTFRPIDEEVRELERSRMLAALAACDGNQTRAAELIDMPRRTFVQKLKQYNITAK